MNVLQSTRDRFEFAGRDLTVAARRVSSDDSLEVAYDRLDQTWVVGQWKSKKLPDGMTYRYLLGFADLGPGRPLAYMVRDTVGASKPGMSGEQIYQLGIDARERMHKANTRRFSDYSQDLAEHIWPAVNRGNAGAEMHSEDIGKAYKKRWV